MGPRDETDRSHECCGNCENAPGEDEPPGFLRQRHRGGRRKSTYVGVSAVGELHPNP